MTTTLPPKQEDSRYAAVRQYCLAQILAVWAAAAIPIAVLAWVVTPLLGALLAGDEPFAQALVLCILAGLIWQFVLTLILTRREQGTLRWSRVRDALWLLSPRDPRSGRVGGRVWLWVIPFFLLFMQMRSGASTAFPQSTTVAKETGGNQEFGPRSLLRGPAVLTRMCIQADMSCGLILLGPPGSWRGHVRYNGFRPTMLSLPAYLSTGRKALSLRW